MGFVDQFQNGCFRKAVLFGVAVKFHAVAGGKDEKFGKPGLFFGKFQGCGRVPWAEMQFFPDRNRAIFMMKAKYKKTHKIKLKVKR